MADTPPKGATAPAADKSDGKPDDKPATQPTVKQQTKYTIIVGAGEKGPWIAHAQVTAQTKIEAKKAVLAEDTTLRDRIEAGLWMEAVPSRYWEPKQVGVKPPPPPQFDV
jgi:hypothetical protein